MLILCTFFDPTLHFALDKHTLALIPLAQGGELTHKQRALFARLLLGMGGKSNPAMMIIRQAQGIELKEYREYMDNLKISPLRYRFALDAILLACCGQNENALMTAAGMMEALRIDPKTAKYLCAVAKSVWKQDFDALFRTRRMEKNTDCDKILFDGYISQFIKDWIDVSDKLIEIRFQKRKSIETIPPDALENMKRIIEGSTVSAEWWNTFWWGTQSQPQTSGALRTAVFENVFFPGNGWEFRNYDKITFKNCVFHTKRPSTSFQKVLSDLWYGDGPLFADVNRLQFEQCGFYDYNGFVIGEAGVQSASFEGCRFENCWLLCDENRLESVELGALIHDYGNEENAGRNTISNSEFVNCGVICAEPLLAILSNCVCVLRGNQFRNCWHYYNSYRNRNERNPEATLFLPGTVDEGNTLTNSARLS